MTKLKTVYNISDVWIFRTFDNCVEYIVKWGDLQPEQIKQEPEFPILEKKDIKLQIVNSPFYTETETIETGDEVKIYSEKNVTILDKVYKYKFTVVASARELNTTENIFSDIIDELKLKVNSLESQVAAMKENTYSCKIDIIIDTGTAILVNFAPTIEDIEQYINMLNVINGYGKVYRNHRQYIWKNKRKIRNHENYIEDSLLAFMDLFYFYGDWEYKYSKNEVSYYSIPKRLYQKDEIIPYSELNKYDRRDKNLPGREKYFHSRFIHLERLKIFIMLYFTRLERYNNIKIKWFNLICNERTDTSRAVCQLVYEYSITGLGIGSQSKTKTESLFDARTCIVCRTSDVQIYYRSSIDVNNFKIESIRDNYFIHTYFKGKKLMENTKCIDLIRIVNTNPPLHDNVILNEH